MADDFLNEVARRVLFFDGAMGTALHAANLPLSDYQGLENCNEILNITRPDVVRAIHERYLQIGCDAVETNTFGGMKHVLAEFGLAERCREINRAAARIAREAAETFSTPDQPRYVAGSMGPGTKLATLRQITFDEVFDSYFEQARGLLEGGADLLIIETCQDLLNIKAVLNGSLEAMQQCGRQVPLIVSVTMEAFGTMLVGSDVSAAVATLEAYPEISVIGFNCATGPQAMSEHVRYLSQNCSRFLSVMPNAGLPQLVNGQAHYTLTPAELARWLRDFVINDGVNIVGGCCGTTPEHLQAAIETLGRRPPTPRPMQNRPAVASIYSAAPLQQETSFLIIGERTNTNGSRRFRQLLEAGDWDGMVEMAREQLREGAHVLDVCAAYVGRDEMADMNEIIRRFTTEVSLPLMIDSTEPPVIEAALKLAGGRCVINSINLEDGEEKLDRLCRLARRFGAAVVALTIDETGMAKEAERKLAVARRIQERCVQQHGLRPADIIFDPLTFTIATGQEADRKLGLETLRGIELIKNELPGVFTSLGVSNVSFGLLPAARATLNSVFLHLALEHGLDAAIVHVAGIMPLNKIPAEHRRVAEELIFDRRKFDDQGVCLYDPLQELIRLFSSVSAAPAIRREDLPVEERLKNSIIDGRRTGLHEDLDLALQNHPALDIINNILLEGMKVVGELFGSGQMQLPFVLQSAETMKAAVGYLQPHMPKTQGPSKGQIVLATVKGDVHDIGKNLVDIILSNNGYTVYNLGIKQPINTIIDKWQETRANAIGLSGLLVKSTVIMKDNLQVLNERGITIPVILGGAALTRRYVEDDLKPLYGGRVDYAKDAFDGLRLMEEISRNTPAATHKPVQPAVKVQPIVTTPQPAIQQRSTTTTDVPIPRPPFWGRRVIDHVPISAVTNFMNEVMLFQVQWEYKKSRRSTAEFDKYLDDVVRPIYRELVLQCSREKILQPRAVYGYWPCNADGNRLLVFDPQATSQVVTEFDFPRESKPPHRCIADYFRPISSGQLDVIAFTCVTMGQRVSDVARHWFAENRYRDYLHLHGLGVEGAEALAEYLHQQVRMELGIADHDARELREIFKQGYQGSRYSFGYPACPNLEDQAKFWPLLQPDEIDVSLTEEWQLEPEQSTTALICHHPEARYFNAR
ncbi:MAG: Methionine synthase [Phycisphaerae bacterium]|nr:Methionine synthase [Phycisphaerae bacterium]